MKKILIGIIGTFLSSGFLFLQAQPDGKLHLYFLNVGQGDAIFMRTPSGYNILIDGGPRQNVMRELSEVLPFFDNTLDYVFLTHPDRDHIEGLLPVLKKYPVKNVVFTVLRRNNYFSDTFLKIIREKNIPVTVATADSDFRLSDGVFIDTLYPFSTAIDETEDLNNFSMISRVVYGENEILLTGDAETFVEEKLLEAGANIDSDILKVGHHGSKTSTDKTFLKAVSPEIGVISVGKNNEYHHPHPSVLRTLKEAGVKILRTDRDGRIEMIFTQSSRTISAPSERNFSSSRS